MTKINQILQMWPKNSVATTAWLNSQGLSGSEKKQYQDQGWFCSIGVGAVMRTGDKISIEGGVYALQYLAHKNLHIGGRSALERKENTQYLRTEKAPVYIFIEPKIAIDKWFQDYNWGMPLIFIRTKVLPVNLGVEEESVGDFKIRISSIERSILEMLCFTPSVFSFKETIEIMEHLSWLRPNLIQNLLENCNSIIAKRLFLFLGEHFNHPWFSRLNLERINLGIGKRSFSKGGIYNSKYKITLPKDFASHEQSPLF